MTRLTPAAEAALAEYLETLATRTSAEIVARANLHSVERDGEVLVTAQSIAAAISDLAPSSTPLGAELGVSVQLPDPVLKAARQTASATEDRRTYAAMQLGALVVIIASLIGIVSAHSNDATFAAATGAVTLAFAAASLVSWISFRTRRRRELNVERLFYAQDRVITEFMTAWASFERAVRDLTKEGDGPAAPLSRALNSAASDGVFSRDDYREVQRLLRMRNAMVHSADFPHSMSLMTDTSILESLIVKVSRAAAGGSPSSAAEQGSSNK